MDSAIGIADARLPWSIVQAHVVRAIVAQALAPPPPIPAMLGVVELRPHQREGAAQLTRVLQTFGGALLADDVGMGKTFTALATARTVDSLVVVAPAALRSMWRDATERAAMRATIVSHEQLSAGRTDLPRASFVIVDEAHHARNPHTVRYRALARLALGAPMLLLTATPFHNGERDLRHLLALFLGERALLGADDLLRACTVRRLATDVSDDVRVPTVAPLRWLSVPHNEDLVRALTAIPAPVPPRDGGSADALLALLLIRLWCSSDWALRAALRRLLARATALTAALQDGRYPLREELASWRLDDDALQLAFTPLVVPAPHHGDVRLLLDRLDAHAAAIRHATDILARGPSADGARQMHLERMMEEPDCSGIVAFTQFEATARGLFRRLRDRAGVAVLSAHGGETATGRLSRDDVLRLALPAPNGVPNPRLPLRLLIATDLLSEGVNLGQLQHVVHLDLPWTPARLQQRVGRLRRPESTHARLLVSAFEPPASAERLAGIVRTLQKKASAGERLIATRELLAGAPWEAVADRTSTGQLDADAELRRRLHAWSESDDAVRLAGSPNPVATTTRNRRPQVAVVRSAGGAPWQALVLAVIGGLPRLVVLTESQVEDSPATVASLLGPFEGHEDGGHHVLTEAVPVIEAWLSARRAEAMTGDGISRLPRVQVRAMHALGRMERALPRAERLRATARIEHLRNNVLAIRGAAAEQELSQALGALSLTEHSHAADAVLAAASRGGSPHPAPDAEPTILCAIVASP